MKNIILSIIALCVLQSAQAQTITSAVPGYISYQGRALDATGAVVGAGTPVNRTVTFRVWDHATNVLATDLLYSEQQTVTISDGEFSVLIGQGVATVGSTFGYTEAAKGLPTVKISDVGVFGGASRYLGVTIDDGTAAVDNEITPRQQIVSSAFAIRAKFAEQLGSNGNTALTALDTGYVGIGNTNPPALFTITGANTSTSTSTPQLLITADDITERLRLGVDSTGTGTGFIQAFKEGTGAQNLLLNPNGGNVGIGTTAPQYKLDVYSGNNPGLRLGPNDSFSNSLLLGGYNDSDHTQARIQTSNGTLLLDSKTDYSLRLNSHANGDVILAYGGGNVGIGTTAPAYKLDINSGEDVGIRIGKSYYGNSSLLLGGWNDTVFDEPRIQTSGHLHLDSRKTSSSIYLNHFTPGNVVLVDGGGRVGIGTASPGAKLDVVGWVGTTTTYLLRMDSANKPAGADYFNIGINTGDWMRAAGLITMSDARIKDIKKVSDGGADLATLMKIEITDYGYKDVVARGNRSQKKVIAQQVETIYPQAVSRSTDVVPDVFKKALVKDGWVELASDLKVGERVKLMSEKDQSVHEVLELRKGGFRTDWKEDTENLFVYGREVKDFRSVDYDAIAMLNVSATQQMKKDHDAEVLALKGEIASLQAQLDARDKAVEARLAALEKLLPKNAAAAAIQPANAAK
jgi:hypothetical protein